MGARRHRELAVDVVQVGVWVRVESSGRLVYWNLNASSLLRVSVHRDHEEPDLWQWTLYERQEPRYGWTKVRVEGGYSSTVRAKRRAEEAVHDHAEQQEH